MDSEMLRFAQHDNGEAIYERSHGCKPNSPNPPGYIANFRPLCYTFSGGKSIHTSFVASHIEVG